MPGWACGFRGLRHVESLSSLQHHRFWVEEEKRFVRLRVSAKGMRIIDKRGITVVLAEIRKAGKI
jgi:large subunit ribosomal protein L28